MILRGWRFVLVLSLVLPTTPVLAADTTPPSTPIVTDDGSYTASSSALHATWTTSDAESGILESQYQLRQDGGTGTIIRDWTSVGTALTVTATGLTLTQAKTYYVGVKSKNGAGLWSAVGWSNGIKVDTTPPPAPGQPTEGSPDTDYNGTGSYTVSWSATTDPESALIAYQLQEKVGTTGTWTTLYTGTARSVTVSARVDKTTYFYQARSQNGAGTWGPYSPTSDGVLIDKTPPTAVTVTDDGAVTSSTTQLHAQWTASTDAESGILDYWYAIGTTKGGTDTKAWTNAGLVLEVTTTNLTLTAGKTYYFTVKARNQALLYSALAYSDGIKVVADTTPPVLSSPTTNSLTATEATLTWTTDEPATSQVDYGLTTSDGQTTPLDTTLVTTHAAQLTSLTPKTTYHVRARSKDTTGNEGVSAESTFTTLPPPDTTPPTGTITINDGAAGTNNPTVTLTLSATDDSGTVTSMRCSLDGTTYAPPEPYATTKPLTLDGADGTKTVWVQFADAAGNWSSAARATIDLDTTPPSLQFVSPKEGDVLIAPNQ